MAGNVFRVIIPSQRALVDAIEAGEELDPAWGAKAKLRSTHNNYFTLPILFIMVSNHYPMTYAHTHNWLILLALIVISAYARHFFNLRHRGIFKPSILVTSIIATSALAWILMPVRAIPETKPANSISDMEVTALISTHCVACHAVQPAHPAFTSAPGGIALETITQIKRWSTQIRAVAVDTEDMPMVNSTNMTTEERQALGQWIEKTAKR